MREEFARIGGRPLGLAFDRVQNLLVCIAGMGVYGVRPDRTVFKVTDRTNRTRIRLKGDSPLYLADDLDVAPDGKICFSEASTRYELTDWALDGFEGRGNGRLICHDPKSGVTRTLRNTSRFRTAFASPTIAGPFFGRAPGSARSIATGSPGQRPGPMNF